MHNHNGKKDDSWTMWVMMICCATPLLVIILFGFGGKALGVSTWVVLGGIAVMMIIHFIIMSRSHANSDEEQPSADRDNKDSKDHSSHGRCH